MEKTFTINAGTALLFNEFSQIFNGYESAIINAGDMIVSKSLYEKLNDLNISINSGNTKVIDVIGEITDIPENSIITSEMSFEGCFLVCEGRLIIEDSAGLSGITGLYADTVYHPKSVNLSGVKGVTASRRVIYKDGAKLHFKSMEIDENSHIVLDSSFHWVDGRVRALNEAALGKLHQKGVSFRCDSLVIYNGLYDKFGTMFETDNYLLVPDDHAVVDEATLNAGTSVLYGDKLFLVGDFTIPYDQVEHLKDFSSLIVSDTVTMPISAAADFKAIGKAKHYDLYEGSLLTINGFKTIEREQLQEALKKGISHTIRVNGAIAFQENVTADDVEAIAAIECNGVIYAPGSARGVLDSKVNVINGAVLDISAFDGDINNPMGLVEKMLGQGKTVNSGVFRM